MILVNEGQLGVDVLVQVNAMGVFFPRGQDHIFEGQKADVQVDRSGAGVVLVAVFKRRGPHFVSGQISPRGGSEKNLKLAVELLLTDNLANTKPIWQGALSVMSGLTMMVLLIPDYRLEN